MKSLNLILFALCGFFVSIECTKDVKCPKKINKDDIVLLPSNKNCSSFIQCLPDGSQVTFLCPSGLHFNPKNKVCDWPANAKCHDEIKCPSEGALLPNPGDCTTYIECSNDMPIIMPCPPGLYFNKDTKQCDYPESANCTSESIDYEVAKNQENFNDDIISKGISHDINAKCPKNIDQNEIILLPSSNKNCSSFIQCLPDGSESTFLCPSGLHFNSETKQCDCPTNAKCDDVIKYPSEDTLLPNTADCTTYIQCSKGPPLIMPCPTGLYFNKYTKQCDYPESANCNPESRIYEDDEEEYYNEETVSGSISNDITLVQVSLAEIFDFTDIDDPLNAVFPQSQKIQLKVTECKVNTKSGLKYGSCVPYGTCLLSRGAPNGFCGLLQTCCIYENTCGKSSNAKVSYFEETEISPGTTNCDYIIELRNKNICQVRLDFIKFNLAPAVLAQPQNLGNKIYKCIDDILRISPNHFNIPDLCGNNDKQHVYVHVNQTDGVTKGVQLHMMLANRNYNTQLFSPSWRIKITQLECPGTRGGINFGDNKDVIEDFPLLAPLGALQYFTEPTGYIKSFGFDGSVANQLSYTYGQEYAIAIKKDIGVCGIRFVPDYMYLPLDNPTGMIYKDSDCHHYLYVPELYIEDSASYANTLVSKLCLKNAENFRCKKNFL
ncbi:unnamed protein product [Phyllotreta striolata]|uniref:Chitin-binding type-2 domain-containing protein n=1 Tax=Phyllotreta striolata TaxID=444603 RepID=A0A9N9TUA8_PHYSR|nr:unnamed protein product [Phyllotreta striolata]